MIKTATQQIKTACILLILFTFLLGCIYPIIITTIAQLLFTWQANGSLIEKNGKTMGSVLIGQSFTNVEYFWGRASATTPFAYNATNSSGSNMGPSNPAFLTEVKNRIAHLKQADPQNKLPIPIDLVTASASGLDPEISLLAALYQVPRIAKARRITEDEIKFLIQTLYKERTFKILGETRVNVLQLNLALDSLREKPNGKASQS